jgi:hypothetical protein
MRSYRCLVIRAAAAALTVVACGAVFADAPASNPPSEWAVWAPKELRFTYQGFTSHYSCDGLRQRVREVLLELGARKDLEVRELGCAGPAGAPTPFPGVSVTMHVLQPASGKGGGTAMPTVPAHWKTIDLTAGRDPLEVAGDCELIEQIKQRLLPQFTVRDVEYSSSCVPHQLSVGSIRLKAQVLVPAEAPAAAGTGAPAPVAPGAGAPRSP